MKFQIPLFCPMRGGNAQAADNRGLAQNFAAHPLKADTGGKLARGIGQQRGLSAVSR